MRTLFAILFILITVFVHDQNGYDYFDLAVGVCIGGIVVGVTRKGDHLMRFVGAWLILMGAMEPVSHAMIIIGIVLVILD